MSAIVKRVVPNGYHVIVSPPRLGRALALRRLPEDAVLRTDEMCQAGVCGR